jgi:hypothetical protein
MSALAEIAVHPVAQALTWALVHFIWQGAALGLLAFAILRFAPLSAQGRYVAGIVTLTAMLAAPIATTAWLLDGGGIVAPPLAAAAGGAQHAGFVVATSEAVIPSLDDITGSASVMPMVLPPWSFRFGLAACFCCRCVCLAAGSWLGGWPGARSSRWHRHSSHSCGGLPRIWRSTRVVRVFESTAVSVPVMMGWLRPVVLLPTAALGGLSPMQLEALIAHELAHVRRHDYVVNLLQSIVETLLFYHPAVWWVSKQGARRARALLRRPRRRGLRSRRLRERTRRARRDRGIARRGAGRDRRHAGHQSPASARAIARGRRHSRRLATGIRRGLCRRRVDAGRIRAR